MPAINNASATAEANRLSGIAYMIAIAAPIINNANIQILNQCSCGLAGILCSILSEVDSMLSSNLASSVFSLGWHTNPC